MMASKINLDPGKVNAVVGAQAKQAARRAAEATADRVRANIKAMGLVDTGELLAGVVVVQSRDSTVEHPKYQVVSTAKHTRFLEFGTRAHGPTTAKFLRFKPKGSSTFVFAKWVRGVRAYGFMRKAFQQVRTSDFTR